jgi:hypothetical protein
MRIGDCADATTAACLWLEQISAPSEMTSNSETVRLQARTGDLGVIQPAISRTVGSLPYADRRQAPGVAMFLRFLRLGLLSSAGRS